MKIAIISDTHIGKKQYRTEDGYLNKFENAGYKALDEYVNIIKKNKPDLVIHCGDIFDVANPSVLAINKFKEAMKKLSSIDTMLLLGNHDFSFLNMHTNCSAVDLIQIDEFKNVKAYAEYEIVTKEYENILFVLVPYVYTTLDKIKEIWDNCNKIVESSKLSKKILITHGVTENYMDRFPEHSDKFMVPDELVKKFNAVFIGHIHTPFEYKDGETLVVSPGGMIDYQAYEDRTGPVFYDLETNTIERKIVKTPHIIKVSVEGTEINEVFNNIEPNIYQISYSGDVALIDEGSFINAKSKAINITLNLVKDEEIEVEEKVDKITDIYKFVSSNYPHMIEAFNEAKSSIIREM